MGSGARLQAALAVACLAGAALLLAAPGAPLPRGDPRPFATDFDGQRAHAAVRELVERFPRRVTGSASDLAAADWVGDRFRALGLSVSEQEFSAWGLEQGGRLGRYRGRNVIGVSPGTSSSAVVVGAHRDVVPGTIQGAEDNGSGTGAMLELARVLTREPHRLTYVFVSFGAEEIGLGGSRYYVSAAPWPTALALSVDAVGQADGEHLALIDAWSLPLAAFEELSARAEAAGLRSAPPSRGALSLTPFVALVSPGTTDSLPFALRNVPAVGLSWERPRYTVAHTPDDTLERLSPESLARVGWLAEGFVRALDAQPGLLAQRGAYLLGPVHGLVPPERVRAAGLILVAYALAQWLLAVLLLATGSPARAGWRCWGPREVAFLGATIAAAMAAGAVLPLQPADRVPDGIALLLWTVWWTLLARLPGTLRRQPPPGVESVELRAASAISFLGFTALASPFAALLVAGYPLIVFPWIATLRLARRAWLAWLLFGVWAATALAGLLVLGMASVVAREIVPTGEAAAAMTLLLLPVATALSVLARSAGRSVGVQ